MPEVTEGKMSLIEHLSELRKHIMVSLLAVLATSFVAFNYSEHLLQALIAPMHHSLAFGWQYPFIKHIPREGAEVTLIFTAPAEALWVHFKIAFIAGIVAAIPVVFLEFWKFVTPALLPQEKKYVIPFVILASLLFLAGVLFCFYVILPFMINFLLSYKTEMLKPMLSIEKYADFCLKLILVFGAIFELPLVVVFLVKMGIVKADTLAKNRRYAILVAFIASGIVTPTPDAFNQILMALPMILLYELGVMISRITIRGRADDKGQEL